MLKIFKKGVSVAWNTSYFTVVSDITGWPEMKIYHAGYDSPVEEHSSCRSTSFSRLQDLNHHCSTGLAKIFHASKNYSSFNSLFYTRVTESGQVQD